MLVFFFSTVLKNLMLSVCSSLFAKCIGASTYQTLNNCCMGYLSEEELRTQEGLYWWHEAVFHVLALEVPVGEWSINAKSRILLSEKVKVKTDFLEKIPLTPPVLEGEINAGFLKDYVFFSVFPAPVPMFGTLRFKCTCWIPIWAGLRIHGAIQC